jgi:MFS family permease
MKNNKTISLFSHKYFHVHKNIKSAWTHEKNMLLFAFEGVLISLVVNLVNNNNNLFATRLGASDFQLSLVIALPQIVAMLVLIPGGILTDRMLNKRRMVILSLFALAAIYIVLGFVPFMGSYSLTAFLALTALSVGPGTLYNTAWQAYFSDIVSVKDRNKALTLRTRWSFIINIATPLLTGFLLASAATNAGKLKFHQSFFWISCVLLFLQIFVLRRISGGNVQAHAAVSLKDLKTAAVDLAHNKSFLGFLGVVMFFYITWMSDWTLYYIGQVNYLKLNEAWLSYAGVGGALVQFMTLGFWSRVNEKHGIRFSIIMGSLGLCFFPLAMIIGTSLPLTIGPSVFLVLNTLSNFAFATIALNILQCLLQVIPEKNKTLSISIYSLLVSLSNAVMPMVGVKVYTVLGANLKALHSTLLIIFAFRIVATGLWTLRWWLLRKTPK